MPMGSDGVVMLAGRSVSTNVIYHSLVNDFHTSIDAVIREEPVPKLQIVRRRARKIGLSKAVGQVFFQAIVAPYLRAVSRPRIQEIKNQYGFNDADISASCLVEVPSVNSQEAMELLQIFKPRVVLVNGTRIIADRVLKSIDASFINMHAGITPRYRGAFGAYWALVENNLSACGVTVHRVDAGIDTGPVLRQALIEVSKSDNFVTYQWLQLGVGIPLLARCVHELLAGEATAGTGAQGVSMLWGHPTLAEYVRHRISQGIR